jgi:molecular chaperone DnaJ
LVFISVNNSFVFDIGENIIMQHTIPFSKVISGSIDTLKVKRQETCKLCNGSGCKPGSKSSKCSTCNGQGLVENIQRTSMGMFKSFSECGKCQGQGEIISDPCSGCNGKGVCFTTSDVLLNIPPGVDAGMTLSIRGEGNAGIKKGQNGDLLVKINIIKDPLFTRDGIDIHTTETISYVEAILGTTIAANSIDGKFNVSVPAGVQPGQKLKIKSKGIPKIGQNYRGDQYITVKVLIPSNVSGPEKEMIEKISALRQKRDIENS